MNQATQKILGVVVADLDRGAIGTRSRLGESFGDQTVLTRVVGRLAQVRCVGEIAVLCPEAQIGQVESMLKDIPAPLRVRPLERRPGAIEARVRIGRAWNLHAWRGGAGQWTCFDEEYHPEAIAGACAGAFDGTGADHVLIVHSYGVLLDVELTSALVEHHLHRNHEMRVTYTPAAPGLCGMALRGDIVAEMGQKQVMPWQLLAYDPKSPQFDTLIRDACMQVDPALSKVPNRFCVDTQRTWNLCAEAAEKPWSSPAAMCLAAARGIAPGVLQPVGAWEWPREVEIELTGRRLTVPPGSVPEALRLDRKEIPAAEWSGWLEGQRVCDDLLITLGGDGDPLLHGEPGSLMRILRAARAAGALSICVQTDLAGGDVEGLLEAVGEGLVDVVSVTMYGHTEATYAKVAGAGMHAVVMANMGRLAEVTRAGGGVPLVVPRLLKVRATIREMEAFFDLWIERCGWAVIDGPTDRAGAVAFEGVVDMAPPARRACQRIWDRMKVCADGRGVACDEDIHGRLGVGDIASMGIVEMWAALAELRQRHAGGQWNLIDPCGRCREWHRA